MKTCACCNRDCHHDANEVRRILKTDSPCHEQHRELYHLMFPGDSPIQTNTETPRTDAVTRECISLNWDGSESAALSRPDKEGEWVEADFARQLERENRALLAALKPKAD